MVMLNYTTVSVKKVNKSCAWTEEKKKGWTKLHDKKGGKENVLQRDGRKKNLLIIPRKPPDGR
jgi:hypothetical protein